MLALLPSCGSIKLPKAKNALLYYGSWELDEAQSLHTGASIPSLIL